MGNTILIDSIPPITFTDKDDGTHEATVCVKGVHVFVNSDLGGGYTVKFFGEDSEGKPDITKYLNGAGIGNSPYDRDNMGEMTWTYAIHIVQGVPIEDIFNDEYEANSRAMGKYYESLRNK